MQGGLLLESSRGESSGCEQTRWRRVQWLYLFPQTGFNLSRGLDTSTK